MPRLLEVSIAATHERALTTPTRLASGPSMGNPSGKSPDLAVRFAGVFYVGRVKRG